ncbi:MAG: diguanylate cyclase [Peptococcaceae bacterium]|jgi:diguanylate cyclase (GGDEF)-like protein|nr:diguanylate cyclase [Peptococcaceae bacterium]
MKVLLAGNKSGEASVLQAPLTQWGYDVVLASDPQDVMEKLNLDKEIRMVLLDSDLPEQSARSLVSQIKNRDMEFSVYTLLLTETNDRDHISSALDIGVDDYVVKPCQPDELYARMKMGQLAILRRSQLFSLASDDITTGLLNKRAFMSRLGQELSRSKRTLSTFSLAMVTVNNLASIDHDHGMWAKNQVLKELAFFLTNGLRVYDFAGRSESDVFLLGICDVEQKNAMEILQRIHQSIQDLSIQILSIQTRLAVNMGVTMALPPFEDTIGSILNRCVQALDIAQKREESFAALTLPVGGPIALP